ncbi:MAG TPA: DICT sensory domain-containing protein [Anaerolineae bacterium]|nr:DICT sensory domain-containing protein [Anaerolineae bacterium]
MKELSLYSLIKEDINEEMFLHTVEGMRLMSHQIESIVLEEGLETDMFVGFQKYSAFVPQILRYRRLAEVASSIYLFGQPNWSLAPLPRTAYIPLSRNHPLTREWFIVVNSSVLSCALVARERIGMYGERYFQGVWTYKPELVLRCDSSLRNVLGINVKPWLNYNNEQQHRYAQKMKQALRGLVPAAGD